ncbi:hypothetical protein ACH5RR_005781 [Cinchona calisaya]|uniref:Serine-rich protein-like protein n=1 Tax=Cinchona calisaya TaxID=153742 RepID=A0ABD3AM63_9GENT
MAARRSSGPVLRSLSPSGRFYSPRRPPFSSSSAFASSTASTFSARSSYRSASPTRVNICNSPPSSAASVRFSLERAISPSRSISMVNKNNQSVVHTSRRNASLPSTQKRTCMCSPTNHPGSFRCSLHKNTSSTSHNQTMPFNSNRLNMRRSAMTNSLVRIGTVEGDLVKRALAALIRPSSHQQRRRGDFQPRPSRLSVMSKA